MRIKYEQLDELAPTRHQEKSIIQAVLEIENQQQWESVSFEQGIQQRIVVIAENQTEKLHRVFGTDGGTFVGPYYPPDPEAPPPTDVPHGDGRPVLHISRSGAEYHIKAGYYKTLAQEGRLP